jgi:hypothetical protein
MRFLYTVQLTSFQVQFLRRKEDRTRQTTTSDLCHAKCSFQQTHQLIDESITSDTIGISVSDLTASGAPDDEGVCEF